MQPHEPSTTDGPTRLEDVTRGRGWWLRTAAIALGALCWMPGDWHARRGWFSGVLLVLVVVGTIAGTVLRERFPWLLWAVGLLGLVGGTTGPLAMGLLVVSNRMPLRDTVIRAAIGTGAFLALNGIPALAMALHQRIVDESSLPTFLALTVLVAVVLPTLAGGHLHAGTPTLPPSMRRWRWPGSSMLDGRPRRSPASSGGSPRRCTTPSATGSSSSGCRPRHCAVGSAEATVTSRPPSRRRTRSRPRLRRRSRTCATSSARWAAAEPTSTTASPTSRHWSPRVGRPVPRSPSSTS